MKIKTIIVLLIIALCVSMAGYLCLADEPTISAHSDTSVEDIAILDGMIVALEDGQITISDGISEYIAKLTDATISEGKELLEIGDLISVQYNGMMTRSLPAQVTADAIACHSMTGVVSDMAEGSFMLTLPDESQYQVNYDREMFEGVQDGMTVTVYFNGASTRSLPPQIAADHIRMPAITGTISGLTDAEFLLTDENGIETIVHISKKTFSFAELADGLKVNVTTDGTATLSLPAQVNAVEILPAAE